MQHVCLLAAGHSEQKRWWAWLLHSTKRCSDRLLHSPCAAAVAEAASVGSVSGVRELLKAGVPPDASDDDGWTGLHFAARNSHIDVMRELLMVRTDVV